MRHLAAALLLILPALSACRSSGEAYDPGRTTIVYRGWARQAREGARYEMRTVLTAEKESPFLTRPEERGLLVRLLPRHDMADLLASLEATGLTEIPASEGAAAGALPSITIACAGRSRSWIGRLEHLGNRMENLSTFRRAEVILIPWSGTTRLKTRKQ